MTSTFLNSAEKAAESTSSSTDAQGREISSPIQSPEMAATTANGTLAATDSSSPRPAVVCVFCASSPGKNVIHMASARSLAQSLHAAQYKLVYGGGTVGIMGELAKTLVALSGPTSVHGVIPRALIRTEKGYDGTGVGAQGSSAGLHQGAERTVTSEELRNVDNSGSGRENVPQESAFGRTTIVPDMHTRKRLMAQHVVDGGPGSGFVALAGGYGTIEEVMEMVTWNQLGIHAVPIVLVNIEGYWDGLLSWVRNSVKEGFVGEGNAGILVEVKTTEEVVGALRGYRVSEERYQLDWTT